MVRLLPLGAIALAAAVVAGIVIGTVSSSPAAHHRTVIAKAPARATKPTPGVTGATTTATVTATTTTATATTTTATSTTGTTAGPIVRCDQNIDASSPPATAPAAACDLAEKAFYEVYRAGGGSSPPPPQVEVWDVASSKYVTMSCHEHGGRVSCRTAAGTVSSFPMTAVEQYSPALAAKFASHRKLGPRG